MARHVGSTGRRRRGESRREREYLFLSALAECLTNVGVALLIVATGVAKGRKGCRSSRMPDTCDFHVMLITCIFRVDARRG